MLDQDYKDPFLELTQHNPTDNVPFLQNPYDENSAIELDYHDIVISPKEHQEHIFPNIICEAIKLETMDVLKLSPAKYALEGRKKYTPHILTEKNSDNPILYGQQGLFAIRDIPAFQVIGIYAGRYLENVLDLENEYNVLHPVLVDRYMHACSAAGIPAISAYGCGNYMSLINDWRPAGLDSLADIEEEKHKRCNCTSMIGKSHGKYFVVYVSLAYIWKDEQILTDYGDGYWMREEYIQKSILGI